MIRIREIENPQLKAAVIAKLEAWRGMPRGSVPEWFELDDADYSDLLIELNHEEAGDSLERNSYPSLSGRG